MNINNIPSGNQSSQRVSSNTVSKANAGIKTNQNSTPDKFNSAVNTSKMDTIEISQHKVKPTLSKIRDNILSDLSKEKDMKAIEDLRSQIESGQYSADAGEIAKSLLSLGE